MQKRLLQNLQEIKLNLQNFTNSPNEMINTVFNREKWKL